MIIHNLQELVFATIFFNFVSTLSILEWASSISTYSESNILFYWPTSTAKFWFSNLILEMIPPRTSKCSSYPSTSSFCCFKSCLSSRPRVDGSSPFLSRFGVLDSKSSKSKFFCPFWFEEIIPKVFWISSTVLSDFNFSCFIELILFCFSLEETFAYLGSSFE